MGSWRNSLAHRHRSYRFSAVDNIADNRFFKTLFPALAEQEPPTTSSTR